MANADNGLDGQGPSRRDAAADDDANQQPGSAVPPQSDVRSWGQPRAPLRRPFSFRNHLTTEGAESTTKTTSDDPVHSSRAPNSSDGPVPAVAAEDPLATAEVKTSEGLGGWMGMGHSSTNVPPEFPGGPSSLIIGGIRFTSGDTRIGGNNARPYVPLPPGPGFFVPRGPPIRAPPYHPPYGSGIRAYVPFPVGGPRYPMENRPRPITFPPCVGRFPPPPEVPGLPRPAVLPTRPPGLAPPRVIRPPAASRDTGFPSWCKKRME